MEYLEGPDQIIPAENITSCDPSIPVKLRSIDDAFSKTIKPMSIPGLLHKIATVYPQQVALITKGKHKSFKTFTYEEYEMNVRFCAKAFLKLGLKRHHSVCILGFNSPEWFMSQLGAIYAGGISTGIYTTNSPEACEHILSDSKANIVVVEDEVQLKKILKIRSRLPELKAIIQYTGEPQHEGVLSWNELIEMGDNETDDELEKTLKTIAVNECCVLVYTSGTVGNPKGVMLSHDNLFFDGQAIKKQLKMGKSEELIVSYLPLSHIAAQVVDMILTIITASTVFFADKNALKGSLVKTLQIARPTRFLGVPRVWEKIQETMLQIGAQNGYLKKQLGAWAKEQGLNHNLNKMNGSTETTWGYFLASKLIFKKIKAAMGLDRCESFASAAAPLDPEVKKYFFSIDMPIIEAFGMSEISGAHTLGTPDTIDLNSVGLTLPGVQTKIIYIDDEKSGEICMNGRHVFMGYLNDPERTQETIDEEGWNHSGDIGYVDEKNKIYVTGRIKELLITAGGENVAPVPIEQRIKKEMPFVNNAVLIGDKRKFLSVLLTFKTVMNEETTIPTDNLTKDVEHWLKQLDSEATTVTDLLIEGPNTKVIAAIQKALDKVNEDAISNAQKIQKFAILPKDFSISSGELGPTLKLKRNIVTEKYNTIIEGLYS